MKERPIEPNCFETEREHQALKEILDYLKSHPRGRDLILTELLKDETISIAKLVGLKESAMKASLSEKKEELANSYALILRYRQGINKKTLNKDADRFLTESSYTGLGKYKVRHYYVVKSGRVISDFDNFDDAEKLAESINGDIAMEE